MKFNQAKDKILNFLGWIDGWSWKDFLSLYIIVLIPELFRQIVYYYAQIKTGSIGFIASLETISIYSSGVPWMGFVEEVVIGLIFITLWFKFKKLKFLTYTWLADVVFDFISVLFFIYLGATPLQMLGLSSMIRYVLRELVFFFIIVGPILYYLKVNVKKLAIGTAIFGAITILLTLI